MLKVFALPGPMCLLANSFSNAIARQFCFYNMCLAQMIYRAKLLSKGDLFLAT